MPASRSQSKGSGKGKTGPNKGPRGWLGDPFSARWPLIALRLHWSNEAKSMAYVQVVRKAPSGYVVVGFLIDLLGFGLQDAFGEDRLSQRRLDTFMAKSKGPWEDCPLELAQELVYGGVAWAERMDLRLPLEAQVVLPILPKPRRTLSLERFGWEGRPLFVGDLDDVARRLPASGAAFADPPEDTV